MKKLLVTFLIMLSTFYALDAQLTKAGGGLTYGTGFHFNNEAGDLHRSPLAGIFISGIYELNLPFHIVPSFTYFIPRTNQPEIVSNIEKTRVSSMMLDVNGHYVFNSLDRLEFYGLAGLNITFAKIKWLGTISSGSDNVLGLNLGAGTYVKITEKLDFCGEVKYIVSRYGQFMANASVLINIDWLKKHENTDM
jgi:opacity protein-like surface antigen